MLSSKAKPCCCVVFAVPAAATPLHTHPACLLHRDSSQLPSLPLCPVLQSTAERLHAAEEVLLQWRGHLAACKSLHDL